ncbi:transcriptional regulator [Faucicola boevrei]|uniref:transcriptional regulator n=1 Tax=Faucicola boevrei TaxID=346665 RepID=UPI00037933B2|nr:YdaS family helix-turn-helix protein [Moraxella boevrei]
MIKQPKNPNIEKLIEMFGKNQRELGEKIGVTQGTITGWLNNRHGVSIVNAKKIEKITEGKIKAVDLCPIIEEIDL